MGLLDDIGSFAGGVANAVGSGFNTAYRAVSQVGSGSGSTAQWGGPNVNLPGVSIQHHDGYGWMPQSDTTTGNTTGARSYPPQGGNMGSYSTTGNDDWMAPTKQTLTLANANTPNTSQGRNLGMTQVPNVQTPYAAPQQAPANPVAGGTYNADTFNGQNVFGRNGTYYNGDGSVNQNATTHFATQPGMPSSQPMAPAPVGPVSNVAPSLSSPTSVYEPLYKALTNQINSNQAAVDGVRSHIANTVNPYDANSQSFRSQLAQSDSNTANSYAMAQDSLRSQLAQRGMLGGGAEGAGTYNLAGQAALAQSQGDNSLYGQLNDKHTAFEQQRDSQLANLAHGDYSGALKGLGDLMHTGFKGQQQGFEQGAEQQRLDIQRGNLAVNQGHLQVTKDSLQRLIDSGNYDHAAQIASGLVGLGGKALTDHPELLQMFAKIPGFLQKLMAGGGADTGSFGVDSTYSA